MKALDLARLIDEEATAGGVSPALMRKLILTGENFNRSEIPVDEVSPKQARGVAQVTDTTWKGLQAQGRIPVDANQLDPRMNVRAAVQVAKDGLAFGGGDERVVAAWYNGGKPQAAAVLAGNAPPAAETQSYLKRTGMTTSTRESYKVADTPTGALAAATSSIQEANASILAQLQLAMTGSSQQQLVQANASEAAGRAMGAAKIATSEVDIANKQDRIDTAALFHSTTAELQTLENKRADADNAMKMLRPQIEAENAVQPWDDPLRWLVNKFTLPGQVQVYNNLNATKNDVTQTIATKNREMRERNALDIAPTMDLMRKAATAAAAADIQQGLERGAVARSASATTVAQSLLQTMHANDTTLDQKMRLQSQFMTTLQLGASGKEDKALDDIVGGINLKLAAAGADPSQLYTSAKFKLIPTKTREALLEMSMSPGYGNGPGSTLSFLADHNLLQGFSIKDPITYRAISRLIDSPEYELEKDAQKKGVGGPAFEKLSDLEQKKSVLDALANQQYKAATDRTKGGKGNNTLPDSNLYKLRIADMAQVPELQDNSFVKDIVSRIAVNPTVVMTHDDVLRTFLAKVKADPSKMPQLSKELSDFFLKGSKWQWSNGGARMLGYPPPTDYTVSGINTTATGQALQLASRAEVEHYAARNLARMNSEEGKRRFGIMDGTFLSPQQPLPSAPLEETPFSSPL